MPTVILHLDSSARHEGSITRQLSAQAVAELKAKNPDAVVMYHDLTSAPLPHIVPEFLGGIFGNPEHANHATLKLSDQLVDQVIAATYIVIGAPMYNFGVPSQLKAWIDYICRAGKTFKYGENGPVGLLSKDKKVIVATATGGAYTEGPMAAYNHVTPYLQQLFGFLGVSDFTAVIAGKQSQPDAANELKKAQEQLKAKLAA